ncbi:MAG: exodeoxyribonuclease III [Candidatus Cloacimonadota bacterium]|nr:MAG: exodeoxyribonuclease III [Candidatus Cloacimonadota bacterium]
MKVISFNVNGIRAIEKKGFLDYLQNEDADYVCLQETKANIDQLSEEVLKPKGYHSIWCSAEKKGYSGVAIYSKNEIKNYKTGFSDERFNNEGRILIADLNDFVLINIYFPNGTKDDIRLQYKMDFYNQLLVELDKLKDKKVLICGDYNTAHNEIDLTHPKPNAKRSGFLPIERAWMDKFCDFGFIDTWRHFHPDEVKYSWWSYRMGARTKNVGWRLDYHFVSENMISNVKSAFIQNDIMGSDHCPVGVELSF